MVLEFAYVITLFIGITVGFMITILSWVRRQRRADILLTVDLAILTTTILAYFLAAISYRDEWIFFFAQVRVIATSLLVSTFFMVSLSVTNREHWLRPPLLATLLIVPTMTAVIALSFPELIWDSWSTSPSYLLELETINYGPFFFVLIGYLHIMAFLTLVILARAAIVAQLLAFRHVTRLLIIFGILQTMDIVSSFASGTPGLHIFPIGLSIATLFIFAAMQRGIVRLSPFAYNHIITHMNDAMLVLGHRNEITFMNPAARDLIAPIDPDLIIGQNADDILVEFMGIHIPWNTDVSLTDTSIAVSPITGKSYDIRLSNLSHQFDLSARRMLVLRDVTQQLQMQKRDFELALERERINLMTRFIQDAAHEFRTPLSIIATASYMMIRTEEHEQRQQRASRINQQIDRITRLVDTMLMIVEIENEVYEDQVCIARIIEDVEHAARMEDAGQHHITAEIDMSLPAISGHEQYLHGALKQLVDNAIRHTPAGTQISIEAKRVGGNIEISVRDTGPGLTSDQVSKIFSTFWRADEAHSTPGMGLGLSIVQRIVRKHGGHIEVESTAGEGSDFRMTLPITVT